MVSDISLEYAAGTVVAHAVHDQDKQSIRRIAVVHDRVETVCDERPFIAAGDQNGHKGHDCGMCIPIYSVRTGSPSIGCGALAITRLHRPAV